jgi:signal transduction histidine kinase
MPTTEPPVRDGIDAALGELDRVQRTLATLLQIAQAESGMAAANRATVDLGELITDIGELYEPAAREKSMSLQVQAAGNCCVNGNRQLLAQLVANLVENSLKYIAAGGHIDVRAQREGATVWLMVADDGPGIAQGDRTAALKPFVRLPQAQSKDGSGLGLSLVAAISRLHHAQLLLEDNQPGLRVRLGLAAGA